jgi:hypothetical protein
MSHFTWRSKQVLLLPAKLNRHKRVFFQVELYQVVTASAKAPQLRYMNIACLIEYCTTDKAVNV